MKNLSKALLVVMALVLALAALTACDLVAPKECIHTGGEASCTEAPVCANCGESYGAALGHVEETVTGKDASCTEAGLTDGKKCSVCDTVIVKQDVIDALGHKDENKDHACDNGCDAYQGEHADATTDEDHLCDYGCGKAASEHVYDSGVVTTEPKCGEKGVKTFTCNCGHNYTEDVTALEHKDENSDHTCDNGCDVYQGEHSDATTDNDHLCDYGCGQAASEHKDGNSDHVCDNGCDVYMGEHSDATTDDNHLCDYGCGQAASEHAHEGVVTKQPNCTDKGVKTFTCNCGDTYTEDIPSNGHKDENGDFVCDSCDANLCTDHTDEIVPGKAATCTEKGLTDGKKCSVCGDTIEAQQEIPAKGHNYSVDYVWSEDNSTCTATATCGNDASHTYSETATVSTVTLNVSATKVTYTYNVVFANADFGTHTKDVEENVTLENSIATINAPAIAGRVASHDYVKFGFHDAEATYEFTINYSEIDVWDNTTATGFASGTGTEDDPYIIMTGAQLAYLAKLGMDGTAAKDSVYGTGIYYKLGASLDLSGYQWTPIAMYDTGYQWTYFNGNFDGAGHKIILNISNTSYGYGLFMGLGANSVVKNLTLYGSVSTAHRAGALAYITQSGATIENVTNYANITTTSTSDIYTGGLIGSLNGDATVMKNCVNYGTVACAGKQVGGLAGYAEGTINSCINYGSVTVTQSDIGQIGGIVGNSKNTSNITLSENYGTITGVNTTGGIAGLASGKVDNCVNYGTVNASSWNIGGIAGRASGGIQNSANYGSVTTPSGAVGGIVGTAQCSVSGCENRGTVKGSDKCGGIAGVFENNATFTDCDNYGDINSAWAVGGIAGYSKAGTSTISGCENHGNVNGTATSNGGIVGLVAEAAVVTVSDCVNYGSVSASWGGAGIAGDIIAGSVSNCINNGKITGAGQLGGIVGKCWVAVSGCTNNGEVAATVTIAAGICSQTTQPITDCVNTGKITTSSCTGVEVAEFTTSGDISVTNCENTGIVKVGDHVLSSTDAKAPTCVEEGNVAYDNCSVCGKNFDAEGKVLDSVVDPATGHTEEVVPGKDATCIETGLTEGKKCSVCHTTLVEQTEIPLANHKDDDGNYKCDVCDETLCTSHQEAEAVRENEKAATCESDGSYDSVVYCSVCGDLISKETITTDALGHDMVGAVEGTVKTYTCQNGCDKTYVKYIVTVNHLNLDGSAAVEAEVYEYDNNYIYTINAKTISSKVASHDYVKGHVLSEGGTINIYYSEVDVWDGTSVSESLSGSGTEEDPYLIQSGADLAYVAKVVNDAAAATANFDGKYFKMTKSINLNGNELKIGGYTADKRFYGYFDGNNCSIRGINATQSLFGKLYNGYIKNLSTYGTVTTTEKKGVAGLVSYMTGATVENITNYVNVTGVQQVAGVVGYLETNTTTFAKNCVNYGTVNATSYQIGGIAGFAKGSISGCTNFGDVTSTGSGYVGGIGGSASGAKGSRSNCVNYGNIQGTDYVGGCFGLISTTTTDCYNYGTAKIINSTKTNVGEVVGGGASYLTYTEE